MAKIKCYIFAGPNGAGKTTFALKYLSEISDRQNFINADLIAENLSQPLKSDTPFKAGREFIRKINEQIQKRKEFAFETTLAGKSVVKLLEKLRKAEYEIILFYLWIPSAAFSVARVKTRVKAGGHDIPSEIIKRRYSKSLKNLVTLYWNLCDYIVIFDNSKEIPSLIYERMNDKEYVYNEHIFSQILENKS